jgi:hypothetical protein
MCVKRRVSSYIIGAALIYHRFLFLNVFSITIVALTAKLDAADGPISFPVFRTSCILYNWLTSQIIVSHCFHFRCWVMVSTIFQFYRVRVMVFNATFNNISAISWRRKPYYPEKNTDLLQVTDKLYNIIVYRVHLNMSATRKHNVSGALNTITLTR